MSGPGWRLAFCEFWAKAESKGRTRSDHEMCPSLQGSNSENVLIWSPKRLERFRMLSFRVFRGGKGFRLFQVPTGQQPRTTSAKRPAYTWPAKGGFRTCWASWVCVLGVGTPGFALASRETNIVSTIFVVQVAIWTQTGSLSGSK